MSALGSSASQTPLGEPLLTADQVAEYLGVDRATVYRIAGRDGGLPVVEISERVKRFRAAEVREFVERRTRASQDRCTRAERLLNRGAR